MQFFKQLIATELAALSALLACALALAVLALTGAYFSSNSLLEPLDAATISFAYTMIIGSLPVVLFGAPIFSVLHYHNHATWPLVLVLGVAPGLVMGVFVQDFELGFWAVVCGLTVAGITRVIRQQGPNSSSKPTLLRNAA